MPDVNIVIDTFVFNRSLAPQSEYSSVLETVKDRCHRIVINTDMISEYETQVGKASAPLELLLRVLQQELPHLGKIRRTANRSGKRLLQRIPNKINHSLRPHGRQGQNTSLPQIREYTLQVAASLEKVSRWSILISMLHERVEHSRESTPVPA